MTIGLTVQKLTPPTNERIANSSMMLRALNATTWKLWDTGVGATVGLPQRAYVIAALSVEEWAAAVGSRTVSWTVRRVSSAVDGVAKDWNRDGWTGLIGEYIPAATTLLFAAHPVRSNGEGGSVTANAVANAVRDGTITTGTEAVRKFWPHASNGTRTIPAVPMWHEYGVPLPEMKKFGAMCADVGTMAVVFSHSASIFVERPGPKRPNGMTDSEWEAKIEAEEADESADDEPPVPLLFESDRLVVTCNLESSTLSFCTPDSRYADHTYVSPDQQWSYVLPRVSWASLYPWFIAMGADPMKLTFN